MTGLDTTVSLALIFSTISAIGVIYTIIHGRKTDSDIEQQHAVDMAKSFAEINVKLNDLSVKTNEIVHSYEKLDGKFDDLSLKLTRQDLR